MNNHDNDRAPFFRHWSSWYLLVIAFLVILIVLFYFFTKRFA